MNQLYMLVGPVASGKSTWTKNFLKAYPDTVVVSTDDILEEWAERDGITYTESFDKYIGAAGKEMNRRVSEAIFKNNDVIWDQTNMTVKARKRKIKQFKDYYKTAVVFFVDDEEQKRRLDARAKATGKFIPQHIVENMAKSYVRPSKEEGFDKIVDIR